MIEFKKLASFRSVAEFRNYLKSLHVDFDLADSPQTGANSAFTKPLEYVSGITGKKKIIGNRWAILPMEGWDCLPNGAPSDLATRRWHRFAVSGAKVLFGCEAAAVMPQGKANTRQMFVNRDSYQAIGKLRQEVLELHRNKFGSGDDPYIGLQLTHSGRFCKPNDDKKLESKTAYAHPLLDKKFHCGPQNVLTDGEVEGIIEKFIDAAKMAKEAGFDFVDIKQAHGYLGHEFLSAKIREGKFGGSFENRTRFFRSIVEGIKKEVSDLDIAMRLSLSDCFPFEKGPDGTGKPMDWPEGENYPFAFGGDGTGKGAGLEETFQFIELAYSLGLRMICATVGSPYYNPHIQRPAAFAVSDGYLPPEDPILGVARQIRIVAETKKRFPNILLIGSGYTYLQEFLPLVGEWVLQNQRADMIGIGRMVLAYPEICTDYLAGKELRKNLICRTFGDCTNAPRAGLVSGCYPLDDHYKNRQDAVALKELKKKNQSGK